MLNFDGAEKMRVDAQGNLVLRTNGSEVYQNKPLIYQEIDGVKKEISGRYIMK